MDRMSPSDGDDMGSTPVSNTIFKYKRHSLFAALVKWYNGAMVRLNGKFDSYRRHHWRICLNYSNLYIWINQKWLIFSFLWNKSTGDFDTCVKIPKGLNILLELKYNSKITKIKDKKNMTIIILGNIMNEAIILKLFYRVIWLVTFIIDDTVIYYNKNRSL